MPKTAEKPASNDRAGARREVILQEAARLFAQKGFASTTMREIADKTGILAGSIYYHFPSKEALFVTVVTDALAQLSQSVSVAISEDSTPWEQLEAAARAHCRALLGSREIASIFTPQYFGQLSARSRRVIVAGRDAYEAMLAEIVDRLDLAPGIDRHVFRIHFLGALNWTTFWYQPSFGLSPDEIASQLVLMLREGHTQRG